MGRGKVIVVGIILLALLVVGGLALFIDRSATHGDLAKVDCSTMLPTTIEFQGRQMLVAPSLSCELLKTIAATGPNGIENHNETEDPWRYMGRLRFRPRDDSWFLVFMTRRSLDYKPVYSLRRRRGYGWSVVGMFDAGALFQKLGLDTLLDRKQLMSDSALVPTDQNQAM